MPGHSVSMPRLWYVHLLQFTQITSILGKAQGMSSLPTRDRKFSGVCSWNPEMLGPNVLAWAKWRDHGVAERVEACQVRPLVPVA
jgi:hypothetical protein